MSTQENDLLYMRFLQEKGLVRYEREVTSETEPSKTGDWAKKTSHEPVDIGKEMDNRYLDFARQKEGGRLPGDQWVERPPVTIESPEAKEFMAKEFSPTAPRVRLEKTGEVVDSQGKTTPIIEAWGTANNIPLPEYKDRTRGYVRQLFDFYKYMATHPTEAIPGQMATIANNFFKGITLNNVDLDKIFRWTYDKLGIGKSYPGIESFKDLQRERMGYYPSKFQAVQETTARTAGTLLAYGKLLRGTSIATESLKDIPAIQAMARGEISGIVSGLLRKPEGKRADDLWARFEQIPGDVVMFTLLDLAFLSAAQVSELVDWSRRWGGISKMTGGGPYAETFSPFTKEVGGRAVRITRAEFTPRQVRDLYFKMQGNSFGERVAYTAEERAAIEDLGRTRPDPTRPTGTTGWREALRRGWLGQNIEVPAEPGQVYKGFNVSPMRIPRQPKFTDIARRQSKIPAYETPFYQREAWSAETGAPPPGPTPGAGVPGAGAAPTGQPPPSPPPGGRAGPTVAPGAPPPGTAPPAVAAPPAAGTRPGAEPPPVTGVVPRPPIITPPPAKPKIKVTPMEDGSFTVESVPEPPPVAAKPAAAPTAGIRTDLLPEGWSMRVGKTRTKEGHTAEGEVDWRGKAIVFSDQKYMNDPEFANHEIAHVMIDMGLPESQLESLLNEYIEIKQNDPLWKEYGKDWMVENNFHREGIAIDLGEYLNQPGGVENELSVLFDKYFPSTKGTKAPPPGRIVEPPKAQAAKEPWQMTRKEYEKWVEAGETARARDMRGSAGHDAEIRFAILSGKPVPPEVLAEYPDLAKAPADTGLPEGVEIGALYEMKGPSVSKGVRYKVTRILPNGSVEAIKVGMDGARLSDTFMEFDPNQFKESGFLSKVEGPGKPEARGDQVLRDAIARIQTDEGTPEDVRLVLQAARRSERLKRVTEALKSRQKTDLLTGVGSNVALNKVKDWQSRPQIRIDLAGVKEANDDPARGHEWTDENIFKPAGAVFRALGDDAVYRKGGTADEFVLLGKPGQTVKQLQAKADLIKTHLQAQGIGIYAGVGRNGRDAERFMAESKVKIKAEKKKPEKVVEKPEEKARRIIESRRAAQAKRGRVGMPKNSPQIFIDIMEITNGAGIRPMKTSTGKDAEEWRLIPKFLKSRNGYPHDEVSDALEEKGYKFDGENGDMWSQIKDADMARPRDAGEEFWGDLPEPDAKEIQAELARQKAEYAPLMNEGESLDAFLERMARDAAEDGFGARPEDIDEYISEMLKNKKRGGEPEGGAPTEAVPFEVAEKPAGYKKAEPKPNIAGEVQRLTSGEFFPREWQGNTDVEIQDNRQNLARFVLENYTPDKGPLENYINFNKKYFIRGETSRGGMAKIKMEQQFPKTVSGGEKDFGEDKSVFGPESQPKGKKPPEPEIPGDSMKPDVFGAEEIRVMNALRSTAQAYTKSLGEAPGFEDKAVDILKSRLLASSPESFRSIGERLGYSKSYVKKQYDAMLELLRDSPAIKEIMARRMVQMNIGPLPSEQDLKHLAKMLRKYFSSYRGADKIIDQQNDRRIGGRMAEIFDQTIDASKINKWLKGQPEGTNEYLAQLMRGTMSGDGMEDIQNSALPADIKEAMLHTRQRVDRLSDLVITHGGLVEETRTAFENNIGKYLAKAYRLYQDKHWSPTDAQKDAFKRWLMNEHTMTPEQADEFIEAELAYGRNDEGIRPQGSRRTRRVPTEHFIRRKALSPAWRKFAGEIDRLPWLVMHTITKQATMAHNAKFLDWISEYLPDHWTADYQEAAQRGWQNAQFAEHNYAYGKLAGKWVDPELHRYITKEFDMARSDMEEVIQKFIMNPFKWTKTIGSLPSHSRNFLSNFGFSMLLRNSITNPLNAKWYIKSLNAHLNKSGSAKDLWKKMIEEGVTETQFYGAEIPRLHKDVMRFDPATWPEKIWDKFVAWPIDKFGELYNFGDSLYRVSAYLKNTAPRSEGGFGMTPTKAVEEINAGLQNYRKLPVAVDFLRRWPFLGPFISFKANTVKIIGKQAEMATEEIKNSATRSRGISRYLRLALFLSVPAILSEISKKVFDVDDKQIKELERWYPEYRRNGTFLYFRGEDDKLKVFDFSFLWPTGDIERFGKSILRGDVAGAKDSLDFFSHPLFDIWSILIKGQDPQWGTKYRTVVDRAKAAAAYLYLPASMPIPNLEGLLHGDVRPGNLTGPQIKAVIDAYNGQPDQYGRVKQLPEEIKNFFTGIRTWDVNPEKLLAQAALQRSGQIRELQGEFTRWLRKNTLAPQWEKDAKKKTFVEGVEKISAELRDIGALGRELRAGGFKAKTQQE